MADKYGIPAGGNNGAWSAKKWAGITWQLTWVETMAVLGMAGWPSDLWATAGAVMSAESGRNPFIYNTYKKGHFGLFQISRSAHPAFFEPNGDGMAWVAADHNAREAYRIYKAQGWGAWEAKTNGGYLAYLAQAKTAAAKVKKDHAAGTSYASMIRDSTREKTLGAAVAGNGQAIGDAVGEAITGGIGAGASGAAEGVVAGGDAVAGAVGDMFLTDLWRTITNPSIWMRFGYGVMGVVLVTGGLFLIVRNTPAGAVVKDAAGAVAKVTPAGKAAKAVKKAVKGGTA